MMLLMAEAVNGHMEAVAAAVADTSSNHPTAAAASLLLLQRHTPHTTYRTDGLPANWESVMSGAAAASPTPPQPTGSASLPTALALPLQHRLAEITEMIHTASLLHDDVVDGSDMRRGVPSASAVFGNKLAVLAGDFMLARASVCLARLRSIPVVEVISTIIEHLVKGEVMQMRREYRQQGTAGVTDEERSRAAFEHYLRKS